MRAAHGGAHEERGGERSGSSQPSSGNPSANICICCWSESRAGASLKPSSAEVTAMKVSPLRNPLRLAFLSFNLALADSKDPAVQELAPAPKGTVKWTFYMPRAMYKLFKKQGDRLKLAADEIFMWAWKRSIESIHSMEDNTCHGKF